MYGAVACSHVVTVQYLVPGTGTVQVQVRNTQKVMTCKMTSSNWYSTLL